MLANSFRAASSFSPSSLQNFEAIGGPAVLMWCSTSCTTLAGSDLPGLTTSDIDAENDTVPGSQNGTVPSTIQDQEVPNIPTEKPPNTTPHKDLTAFEQQLWHHKDNEFFTHFKAKNWYQDEQDLWREKTTHRLVIPTKELRTQIMHACHDTVFSGHFGAARTLNLCERLFFWPNMKKHIQSYCSSCKVCQSIKPSNRHPVGGLQPLPVPSGKWKTVTVDMITDLPKSYCGFDSILVFVDKTKRNLKN